MTSRPAIVGTFILGALALAVLGILFFGGRHWFARPSRVVVYFDESVAGLDVGAPVTFHGARIGRVSRIGIRFSPHTMQARIPVVLEIDISRVVLEGARLTGENAEYQRLVEGGLRAQLALQSIITGQMRVDLDFLPGTPAKLVGTATGLPEIPAVSSDYERLRSELTGVQLRKLAETAQRALASIDRLSSHLDAKLDLLASDAHNSLEAATHTLHTADDAMRQVQQQAASTLRDLDALLVDARRQVNDRGGELSRTLADADRAARQAQSLLASVNDLADPRSQFRGNLQAAMRDLAASASSLRSFSETIERNPAALMGAPGH